MDRPSFSIVTPTLNAGEFLHDCIESVRVCFANYDYEHIIVDGGSTDETKAIAGAAGDHVRVLDRPGSSMYVALNEGLEECSRSIFYQLNADDLAMPGAPDIAAKHLSRGQCDVLTGSCITVDQLAGWARIKVPLEDQMMPNRLACNLFVSQPSTYVLRSALASAGGYPSEYRYAGDTALWLRMPPSEYRWKVTPDILSVDRLHQGSARLTKIHLEELGGLRGAWPHRGGVQRARNAIKYAFQQWMLTGAAISASANVTSSRSGISLKVACLLGHPLTTIDIDMPGMGRRFTLKGRTGNLVERKA